MRQRALLVLLFVVSPALATVREAAAESRVDLVSRGIPSGSSDTGNGASGIPAASRRVWSADGRWLVFTSKARDLVPGQLDRENTEDVFLYDRSTGSRSLVSRRAGSTATTANAGSTDPVISPDGRWIAFVSSATDLVAGQVDSSFGGTNSDQNLDVFVHDRLTGTTTLVSHLVDSPLTAAGRSTAPALSADGAVVAFQRASSVYLSHFPSGEIVLVSHQADSPATARPGRLPSVSADGRFVMFISQGRDLVAGQIDPGDEDDVFLYDRDTGTTSLVSHAAGAPLSAGNGEVNIFQRFVMASAALSTDGRWVAFSNLSSNLVPGQAETSIETVDVFLWDRITDTTILVSRSSASPVEPVGGFLIDLSSDGGAVAFGRGFADRGDPAASAPELYLFDRASGSTILVNEAAGSPGTAGNGPISDATLSANGRFIAFRSAATDLVAVAVDTNDAMDIFLFDRLGGGLSLLSHTSGSSTTTAGSTSATPRISPDGAFVAFANPATDLVAGADLNGQQDVFLHNRAAGTNGIVSLRDPDIRQETPNGASAAEGLSADGRFVVFTSDAVDVVPGASDPNGAGTDVFLWDRNTGVRSLVSRSAAAPATTANGPSSRPAISADGRWVTFQSTATDLVAGQSDANGADDVFLWDRLTGDLRLVSSSGGSATQAASGLSEQPAISADGRWIAFLSSAEDLIDGQVTTVAGRDAFLWDRDTAITLLVSRTGGSAVQGAGASMATVSADGSSVGFLSTGTGVIPGQIDTAGTPDVFLFTRATGAIELVSHSSASPTMAGNALSHEAVLSSDGSRVAFTSSATDIVAGQDDENSGADVFLWTRGTGASFLVSRRAGTVTATPDRVSAQPSLSADGRLVAFESAGTNVVAGQVDRNTWDFLSGTQDIFLFDTAVSSMTLVSHQHGILNATGDQTSRDPVISADGLAVAFRSTAGDLLPSVLENTYSNVYVFERLSGRTRLASRTPASPLSPGEFDTTPRAPRIGAGGSHVAFTSLASNLVPGDFNQKQDAFLFSDPPVAADLFLIAPCRLFDTRRPEDGPALVSNVPVLLEIDGGCGIPPTATSLAFNATVVAPTGAGFLTLYPGDSAMPGTTSTVNFTAGLVRTNNTVVRLALDGTGTLWLRALVGGNGTVHVVLDVVGYFE